MIVICAPALPSPNLGAKPALLDRVQASLPRGVGAPIPEYFIPAGRYELRTKIVGMLCGEEERTLLDVVPAYVATIEVPAGDAGAVADALEGAEAPAALAVSMFELGEGQIEVSAHYADEPALEQLLALIGAAIGAGDFGDLRIEQLLPQDWVARAESLRAPVRAGRFVVHGRHHRGKFPRGRNAIEIDAGLAFGTAHHATTRGCLIALDRLSKQIRPHRVLDVGTGTGILAIAAARALNVPVLASDIDPVATATAAANARMNGVDAKVQVLTAAGLSHLRLSRASVDLLFANILLNPLLALAPAFAGAVRPGGICVLSGLLNAQARQVEARFLALGFSLEFANPSRWMDDLAAPSW